jgi:hypothetical protein
MIARRPREKFYEYLGETTAEPLNIAGMARNMAEMRIARDLKLARLQELRDQLERARQTAQSYRPDGTDA